MTHTDTTSKTVGKPRKFNQTKARFESAKQAVLTAIDVLAEYRSIGLRTPENAAPRESGWVQAYAIDRQDNRPSAAINIQTGFYKDSGGCGKTLSFWDAQAQFGKYLDWYDALKGFAEKTGTKLPKRPDEAAIDQVEVVGDINRINIRGFLEKYPGVRIEDLQACGCRFVRYPKRSPEPFYCIAWPFYGPALTDAPHRGYVLQAADGREMVDGRGDPQKRLSIGQGSGLSNWHGLNLIRQKKAKVTIKVEGYSDMMTLLAILPAEKREAVAIITNACGSTELSLPNEVAAIFAGQNLVIIHDADDPGQNGAQKWVSAAQPHVKSIRNVQLFDQIEKKSGKDLRNWIADGHTWADFEQLIEMTEPIVAAAVSPTQAIHNSLEAVSLEEPDDPHRLARLCLASFPGLKYYRGDLYFRDGIGYRTMDHDEARANVDRIVKGEFDKIANATGTDCHKVKRSLKADVLDALQALTLVPSTVRLPCQIQSGGKIFSLQDCVIVENGIVTLSPLQLQPAGPDLFAINVLPFRYNENATCPNWTHFMSQLWACDSDSESALQEMFGYLLLPQTSHQKMFVIIGPRRSGKGTIARVLRELIGRMNVAAPTLGSIGGPFGLQPLLNKTVAIIGDARLSGRADSSAIVERILSITGEDLQTVERKHQAAITDHLPVRFVLISNELPRLDDASATLPSRMILFRLRKSFYGSEDPNLTDRLLQELPGILNWAIEGLQRLRSRGYFLQPGSSQELLDDMEVLSSPMTAFVKDRCHVEPACEVPVSELFSTYQTWCAEKGRKPASEQVFGRDLRAAVPAIDTKQRREFGARIRVFINIRLANEKDWSNQESSGVF